MADESPAPPVAPLLAPGTVVGSAGAGTSLRLGVVSDRLDEMRLPLVLCVSPLSGLVREEAWLGFTGGAPALVFGGDAEGRARTLVRARGALWNPWPDGPRGGASFVAWARGSGAPGGGDPGQTVARAGVVVVAGAPALVLLPAAPAVPDEAAEAEHGLAVRAPGWRIMSDGFIVCPSGACIRARATRAEALEEATSMARSLLRDNPQSLALGHAHYPTWRACVASFVDWHLGQSPCDEPSVLVFLAIERDAVAHGIDWAEVIAAAGGGDA